MNFSNFWGVYRQARDTNYCFKKYIGKVNLALYGTFNFIITTDKPFHAITRAGVFATGKIVSTVLDPT